MYDDMIDARVFHPNVRLLFEDVELATTEVSEVEHECAAPSASAGSHSIWMATYLPAGKLTIKTAGSSYQVAGGPTDDTVVSLYHVDGDAAYIDFDMLDSVACGSGGTGAGKVKANIVEGTYLVQISLESGATALDGSTVAVLAKFTSALKLAVDEPQGARQLFFPKLYSFALSQHATVSLKEPVDPQFDPAVPLQKSVWFKFNLATSNLFYIAGAYGEGNVSVFRREADGSLVAMERTDMIITYNLISHHLTPGSYLVRLSQPTVQVSISLLRAHYWYFGASIMLSTVFLTPPNPDFGIDEDTPDATATLEGWTIKNGSGDDTLVCVAEDCGFQFHSSGPDEATALVGKSKLSSVKFRRGEMILIQHASASTGTGYLNLVIEFSDAAGKKMRVERQLFENDSGALVPIPQAIFPTKAKVTIQHRSTTPGDTFTLYSLMILPYRLGTPLPRGSQAAAPMPLPLPPAAR